MYCKICGKEIINNNRFCSYCGTDLQPPKASKNNGVRIAIALILTLVIGGGSVFAYVAYSSENNIKKISSETSKKHKNKSKSKIYDDYEDYDYDYSYYDEDYFDYDYYDDFYDYDYENDDFERDYDMEASIAEKLTVDATDMSDKTLYYSYDGKTKASSYWEFLDDKNCKLVFEDGGYYEGTYTVMEGEIGMYYTELGYPEYGLTYDELKSAVDANKEDFDNCKDYVVLVFDNLIEYAYDGTVVDDEAVDRILFYGATFDEDGDTLYELVGGNSMEYYYFIDFKDDTF